MAKITCCPDLHFWRKAHPAEQKRRKAASSRASVAAVDLFDLTPAGGEVNLEYSEKIPDHGLTSFRASSAVGRSGISTSSRQSCGQKGTQRPQ
jgi:hypothetical protein